MRAVAIVAGTIVAMAIIVEIARELQRWIFCVRTRRYMEQQERQWLKQQEDRWRS
jgi:hypothetical protein